MQLAASLYPPWYLNKENIREWHQMCMDVCTGGGVVGKQRFRIPHLPEVPIFISTRFLKHHPQASSLCPHWPLLSSESHGNYRTLKGQLQLAGHRISPARPAGYYVKCDEKGHRWLVIPLKNKGKKINHKFPFSTFLYFKALMPET